ncbi:MAG: hypothetical protein IT178_14090 [Acidobacteria bacterium]|nr:hypothetical protein [Acidobacteriota bacterium]
MVLPDGVGARNMLLGSFRPAARGRLALQVLQAIPTDAQERYAALEDDAIVWAPYTVYRDHWRLFMLRNTLNYAHMFSIDTWAMRCLRVLPIRGRWKGRLAAMTARTIGRAVAAAGGVGIVERRLAAEVERLPDVAAYRDLLVQLRPAVLLSSNHRPYGLLPLVLAARSLNIPTATCIFSWDNLTSKGRIAAPFDHYFVWSDLMRRELQQFYPEIPADRIHITGAPQFDPHADRSLLLSREDFCARIGADPSRPIICYSSGEPNNSPEDQDHVALLLQLIRDGRIQGQPQVVLRPTPTVEGHRFNAVRTRYPELIYSRPRWQTARGSDWSQMLPLADDISLLVNLAHHSAVNVSVASTMTLDFAIHGTPIVNVAFDLSNPPPFRYPLWDYYYQFEHYRPVVDTGAALFSRNMDELAAHVNACLDNRHLHDVNHRRLLEIELGVPVGESSRRIVETLRQIAGAAHSHAEERTAMEATA